VFLARSVALTPGTLGLKRLRSKRGKGGLRPAEEARRMLARLLALSSLTLTPSRLSKKKHTSGTKAKLKGV